AGTYEVKLTVTDDDGATNSVTSPVTVTEPAPNQPPTAAFTHTAEHLTVSVDASASVDVDGEVVSYEWDFGDGGSASGVTASHVYGSAGTYEVTLTVTDDDGAVDEVTESVTVTDPPVG